MKTILEEVNHKIEIKNSNFITYLFKITTEEEAREKLELLKQKYKDASHHCYAYRLPNLQKSSDDKEPSGTAGIPILQVLEKNELTNVLAIVVRYFGGIKLGAGGLVRAYTKATTETIKETKIIPLKEGYLIEITFPYEKEKQVNNLLKENEIKKKTYEEQITYLVKIEKEKKEYLEEQNLTYRIVEKILF